MMPLAVVAAASAGPFRQCSAFVPTSPRVAPVGGPVGRRTQRDMFSLQFNQFNDPGSNQNKNDDEDDNALHFENIICHRCPNRFERNLARDCSHQNMEISITIREKSGDVPIERSIPLEHSRKEGKE